MTPKPTPESIPASKSKSKQKDKSTSKSPPKNDVTTAARNSVATTRDVLSHMFGTDEDGNILNMRRNYEIADSLVEKGFETVQFEDTGETISINQKNITPILDLTFREQKVKLRLPDRQPSKAYFEPFEARVARLKHHHGLKILEVVRKNGESGTEDGGILLAQRAARTFAKTVGKEEKAVPTVGIGGGQTLRLMALYLDLEEFRPFTSTPLNFVMRVPEEKIFDSDALAKSVYRNAGRGSSPGFSIPPTPTDKPLAAAKWHHKLFTENPEIRRAFRACIDPDVVFVGAGNFYEDSQAINKLTAHLGMDYKFLSSLHPRPVGDMNFCFFDKDGNDITSTALQKLTGKNGQAVSTYFPDEPSCHPFFLGLNMEHMKKMVSDNKTVVVVAGCDEGSKARCLHALLKSKTMNGLVTDSKTMDALLALADG